MKIVLEGYMIQAHSIRLEYGRTSTGTIAIVETPAPMISWAISGENQAAWRIRVGCRGEMLWDSQWVRSASQCAAYAGKALTPGDVNELSLESMDESGAVSAAACVRFCLGALGEWKAPWIGEAEAGEDTVPCFSKTFFCRRPVEDACLFASGIAYQRITLNGAQIDDSFMNPALSEYEKRCYYAVYPGLALQEGENRIGIEVAAGWRSPHNVCYKLTGRVPDFTGPTLLSAALRIRYRDGGEEWLYTDESWKCRYGAIVYSNIFMGETYDAAKALPHFAAPDDDDSSAPCARVFPAPCEKMCVQALEPVRAHEEYPAVSVMEVKPGVFVADFGQNIAGLCRLRLPRTLAARQEIRIAHMEMLDEDGTLYMPPLRNAACTDRYIALGDGKDAAFWQPQFTYHGFRYAQVEGLGQPLRKEDICAVSLYSDVDSHSSFRCGSAIVNAIQKMVVQTERANIHSILTDCPQRDERMGWMNDATVRFEETPYNFDIGRLFPKVVRDLLDVQDESGAICCTAPFAFGGRPADPVCSSFLVAGWEAYMHTGNLDILREGYDGFKAWNDYLASRSQQGIVDYSYYGDWAGPAYACEGEDGAKSSETPGILMSTGYHYFNARLLARMAAALDREDEATEQNARADAIREAFLAKWWDEESGKVATGSQACQAFALWLGILPEEGRAKAAKALHDDLVAREYRFTTGNLCTRYMMDALTQWGYLEDAWTLITRETYPSWGFMLQNEATTVWERFELKKNPGMNSHNHPMFGAVGYWFYAYLAGVKPLEAGWQRVAIHPYMPKNLLSAQATVETPLGDVSVRWVKRYGQAHLYVQIPCGAQADVTLPQGTQSVFAGFHHFIWPLDAE